MKLDGKSPKTTNVTAVGMTAGFSTSAPGKLILAGEHSVVYGKQACATVLDIRTVATFTPSQGTVSLGIEHDQLGCFLSWPLDAVQEAVATISKLNAVDERRSALATQFGGDPSTRVFLLLFCLQFKARFGMHVRISSDLPLGAGLGSSASFCASLAAGFHYLARGLKRPVLSLADKEQINHWAFQGERILHGSPSGVDNSCVVYGGLLSFRKGHSVNFLGQLPPAVRFVVTNTKVPRNTLALVQRVAALNQRLPGVVGPILEAMDKITSLLVERVSSLHSSGSSLPLPSSSASPGTSTVALSSSAPRCASPPQVDNAAQFCEQLAEWIRMNQCLLEALGVGHPAITKVITASVKSGFVSKLTGAGGGGCVITLIPPGKERAAEEFARAMRREGFECFNAAVGQEGVRLHVPAPHL